MKKIKKIVLSVLLFTFAFISVHDFIMPDIQIDSNYEMLHFECENTIVDLTTHIHDSIHSLLLDPLLQAVPIALLFPYQREFELRDFFVSYINAVPQRPPLA